jgi:hypothetical protein
MQRFEDFLATTRFPPNPYRNLDNSLRTEPIWNGGIPSNGYHLFNFEPRIVQGFFTCTHCHSGPLGSSEETLPRVGPPSPTFKVAPLRNVYERDGFSKASLNNNRGFGPTADGSQGDISQGLLDLGFTFPPGEQGLQERHDIEAFLVSFGDETHAAVGQQVTLNGSNKNDPAVLARLETLIDTVDGAPTEIGLVFKGRNEGVSRGAYYVGNDTFQTDLAAETIGLVALLDLVAPGSEMTATVAPYKSRIRIGVDRDEDGKFDRDEVLAGTDPANPGS